MSSSRRVLQWQSFRSTGVAAVLLLVPWVAAAQAVPFCQGPGSRDPSWSADGERIYFSSTRTGNSEIWSMRRDGSDQRQLTDAGIGLYYPFASPDGSRLALSAFDSAGSRVALVSSEGGPVEFLTEASDEAGDPIWTQDGRLVYSSARGGERDLWLSDLSGPGARLFALDGDEWAPRVTRAGDRVVFATNRDGNSEIYIAGLDGSGLRNLSRDGIWDGVPNLSPDGRQVAYYSRDTDAGGGASRASWATAELKVVSVDGGASRTLTSNRHRDQSPTWSPDGGSLAYSSCASGNLEVWVMDADGGNPRRLTETVALSDSTAIAEVVRKYVEGWRAGDVDVLATVLEPNGVIVWPAQAPDDPGTSGDPALSTMTFEDAMVGRRPNPGFGEPWRLERLTIVDRRLAVAEVFIARPDNTFEYTDQLTLYNLRGSWKIVVKSYSLRRD